MTSLSSSDTQSATPSATATASSSAPSLTFSTIANTTTCGSNTISWSYESSSADFELELTVIGTATSVYSVIADLDPSLRTFTWQSVNVPAGQYVIQGSISDSLFASSPFSVTDGGNTSCLSSSSASITLATSSLPQAVAATSKSTHAGAIAGGVVGGLAFIAAIFAAFLFYRCRRTRTPTRSRRPPGPDRVLGKWNGLHSRESSQGHRRGVLSMSMNKHMHTLDVESSPSTLENTPVGSNENIPGYAKVEKDIDKDATPSYRGERLDTVPTLTHQFIAPPTHAYHAHRASFPPSPDTPSRRSLESSADTEVTLVSPSPENMVRSSSVRRQARKPVPVYTDDAVAVPPPVASPSRNSSAEPSMTPPVMMHNIGATHSREDLEAAGYSLPHLNHKSSMGRMKPVHYVMPDPPPPPPLRRE